MSMAELAPGGRGTDDMWDIASTPASSELDHFSPPLGTTRLLVVNFHVRVKVLQVHKLLKV